MERSTDTHSSGHSRSSGDDLAAASSGIEARIHILVAGHSDDLRECIARLLRRWWSVEAVGDTTEALAAIRRQRPTLVLTDADLPAADGVGLREALRGDPATQSIPLVMLADHHASAADRDATACLVKPFSSRELMACVSARLEEHLGQPLRHRRPVRRLLNRIDLPIAVLRREGLIVEDVNRAYADLVGDRVIGRPFGEPAFAAAGAAREASARAFASGATFVARELTVPVDRNGEVEDTHWHFAFSPIDHESAAHERRVLAIGVEITDAVRARQERDALAAEAISANKTKDQFLASLAHELRNPLSPILTALQLMRAKGLCSHELDVVERQVGVIVRLVGDLLDVSRLGRSQVELRKERIGIPALIVRALETVDPLITERGHSLRLLASGTELRVDVDPARLTQVLANLLANAAKYSERGSEITVRVEGDGPWVRLSVEDRGIGIAPEMLPHVFEPFVQERSAVRRSRGGLGLGLAIVRSLVEAHGGRVTAHSGGPNQGSTFCVELPAATDE